MLGEATLHYAWREFQQALQLLLEVVRISPGLPHPYQTLGLIYEEVGQHKKALRLFMMAAHLSKKDAVQWRHLAVLAAEHGEHTQAIYCLGKVLSLHPDDVDAHWEHALMLSEVGQHKKAVDALVGLLARRPGDVQVLKRLTLCYYNGPGGQGDRATRRAPRLDGQCHCVGGPASSSAAAVDPAAAAAAAAAAVTPAAAAAPPAAGSGNACASGAGQRAATEDAASCRGGVGETAAEEHAELMEVSPSEPSPRAAPLGGDPARAPADVHCLHMLLELLIERGRCGEAAGAPVASACAPPTAAHRPLPPPPSPPPPRPPRPPPHPPPHSQVRRGDGPHERLREIAPAGRLPSRSR